MSIQFPCDNCTKKIEVDDEFAGLEAQCPYCETVVQVPRPSRPVVETDPSAAPGGGFTPRYGTPPPPGLPTTGIPTFESPRDGRQRNARRMAIASVLTGLVGTVLMLVSFAMVSQAMTDFFGPEPDPITPADMQEFQESLLKSEQAVWLTLAPLGGLLASLAGLALGVFSLIAAPRRNVLGWFGCLIAGGWIFFVCAGLIAQFTMG